MTEREVLDLLTRWYRLRQVKLDPPVPPLWSDFYIEKTRFMLCERWKFWRLDQGIHGEKVYMSDVELKAMVEEAEGRRRKPVGHADELLGDVEKAG